MAVILWRAADGSGLERATLRPDGGGFCLEGTALLALRRTPLEARYRVTTDEHWRTRVADVLVTSPDSEDRVTLIADGEGHWTMGPRPLHSVAGCLDVDLGFTPATNTLPIRRLDLPVGEHAQLDVAWVAFPSLRVGRSSQRYERLDRLRWRYRSGDFSADLLVGDEGLVREYEGLWSAIAGDRGATGVSAPPTAR